SAQP
ncbi:hypothetical protein AVEN_228912-1, partial [Araneus ventricosus]